MKKDIASNSLTVYAIILFGVFVLLFFTRGIFANTQILLDERSTKSQEVADLKTELSRLNELQNTLSSSGSEAQSEIQGFASDFSEKDIVNYLYSYASQINSGEGRMVIKELKINQGNKSDLGFLQANVDISAIFSSESTMLQFLDFLVSQTGDYRFYIPSFEYPLNDVVGNIQVEIPARLYYK